jgi:N-dimethylarginine dimethylaminohydrolase
MFGCQVQVYLRHEYKIILVKLNSIHLIKRVKILNPNLLVSCQKLTTLN